MQNLAPGERRQERIAFETSAYVIHGTITLPRRGYLSRLSDYLNREEISYIPLTDVEMTPRNGGGPSTHSFLALAKASIQFAYSLDDEAAPKDDSSSSRLDDFVEVS